jgi:hypothetical protein
MQVSSHSRHNNHVPAMNLAMPVEGTCVASTGPDITQTLTASVCCLFCLWLHASRPKNRIGPLTCGQGPTASIAGRTTCSNDSASITFMRDVSEGE